MNHFYNSTAALAISALCLCAPSAEANTAAHCREFDISSIMRSMAPNAGLLQNPRNSAIDKINSDIDRKVNPLQAGINPDIVVNPTTSVGPVGNFRDMDGPNGELWYYTTKLWSKTIQHEYYTEYILTEYEFEFYDSKMNRVGKIHDKMRYRENEVRVPGPAIGIDLLPVITQKFFNADDKYEVIVSIAVNTTRQGHNNYRSVIYSLGGEKETLPVYDPATGNEVNKSCDKPVYEYDAFVNDVLDASTDGTENYYFTFSGVVNPDFPEDPDTEVSEDDYWDLVTSGRITLSTYSKAGADGKLQLVKAFQIPYLNLQGNQESSAVVLSMMRNGKPYMIVPYYKEPFFNPYHSANDDISMREGNSFVIDMYELHPDRAVLAHHTEIPMARDVAHDAYFTYYAVGSLRWDQDVDFGHFSTDGKPSYYVTRSNFKISTDSESDFCYYVYDSNANLKKTIFEYAESNFPLSDVEGAEPQHCFVYYDEDYIYYMVDLYTGLTSKSLAINYMLKTDEDSDADVLLANFDRVQTGANDWRYCFELKVPTVDEDENDVLRLAWFDKKGKYDHMDYVNMGKNVYYAKSFMNGKALDPHLFKKDDAPEYMLLIKRGIQQGSTASHEELLIAQPQAEDNDWKGNALLHLAPCEKGVLRGITINPVQDGSDKLMVTWLQEGADINNYTADFYDLPFDKSAGIDGILSGHAPTIAFDGYALTCPGKAITVFNLQGIVVAKGNDSIDTTHLPAGIYMAASADASLKFIVK